MLAQTKPRDRLRVAIGARDECQRKLDVAEVAAGRAQQLVRQAENHLATFADVDGTIAAFNADAVTAWASGTDKEPTIGVPAQLAVRRNARANATDRLATARATHSALADKVDEARVVLADANLNVSEAARAVLVEEATVLAGKLYKLKREEWALSARLRGLGEVWLPSANQSLKPMQLPSPVLEAITARESQHPPSARPEIKHAAMWRSFFTALLSNHDARPDAAL